jgi:hypothetical protein
MHAGGDEHECAVLIFSIGTAQGKEIKNKNGKKGKMKTYRRVRGEGGGWICAGGEAAPASAAPG